MDLFDELENMAANALDLPQTDTDTEISSETITRWQVLFDYPYAEASDHIEKYRDNISRKKVTDEHWEMVRPQKEADGYDREAYEYSIELGRANGMKQGSWSPPGGPSKDERLSTSTILVKLEGPLDTAIKIQDAARLAFTPTVITGTDDSGEASSFCRINGSAKKVILEKLSAERISFHPTFVRISKAEKALSNSSLAPTLGIDSTLPQHRANDVGTTFSPTQDQYPVWYFFYGTLASPETLCNLFAPSEQPILRPASVIGGVLKTWAGKYKALIDGPSCAVVNGWAYQVVSCDHEEFLQYYESENYEVARCVITMKDNAEVVNGLTFRFVNISQSLI